VTKFLLFAAALSLTAADYDLLIRNARVVDGAGNAWFRADVGVKDGKIAAVGKLNDATSTRTIDARERYLTPDSSTSTPTSKPMSSASRKPRTSSSTA
jgi:adenine deaminase